MLSSLTSLAARGCLAYFFLYLGYHHLLAKGPTMDVLISHRVPMSGVIYIGLLVFELLGGLLILMGSRCRLAAFFLSLYWMAVMIPFGNLLSPLLGHVSFMLFLAVFGGLLHVMALGGGRISFDRM